MKKQILTASMALALSSYSYADENQTVNWTGTVYDNPSSHTTKHFHRLIFKNRETQEAYDIVGSENLRNLHHDTNKNFVAQIEGYITSKFLFWGGNLVVTSYKILEESDAVLHTIEKMRDIGPASNR
jgi:hypothetical protein